MDVAMEEASRSTENVVPKSGKSATGPQKQKVEWFKPDDFSAQAAAALADAERIADEKAGGLLGVRHIAHVLFFQTFVGFRSAWGAKADVPWLQVELRKRLKAKPPESPVLQIDHKDGPDLVHLFIQKSKTVQPNQAPTGIEDLLVALFDPEIGLEPLFERCNFTLAALRKSLPKALRAWGIYEKQQPSSNSASREFQFQEQPKPKPKQEQTKGKSLKPMSGGQEQSNLASLGVDLVEMARQGKLDPVCGREEEVSRVLNILSRRTKNNACLIGPPGVGKTAIAEAIAQHVAAGTVPKQLESCEAVWSLSIGALLAGTSLRGDFEKRMQGFLDEIRQAGGRMIVFLDELHLVIGAGKSEGNNIDAANLLKPMLARGEIRCIGATTSEEYKNIILKTDPAFERRFQPVQVNEPSIEVAMEMIQGVLPLYTDHHGVSIEPETLEAIVRLSHQHIKGRYLPDKAIDVLDEACCLASNDCAAGGLVVESHVSEVISRWSQVVATGSQASEPHIASKL